MTNVKEIKKGDMPEMLKKIIEKLAQDVEPETKKVKVGTVPFSLVDRVTENDRRHDRQHAAIKEKGKRFIEQVEKEAEQKIRAYIDQLEEEHRPECREHSREHAAAWNAIYDELKLPESERQKNHSLNAPTGDIFEIVEIDPEIGEPVDGTIH